LDAEEVTVVPYTSDIHGVDYRSALQGAGYDLAREQAFGGVSVEWWRQFIKGLLSIRNETVPFIGH
jgi:hypothetical protein